MSLDKIIFFIKMFMLMEYVMFLLLCYVWFPCSCRCTSAIGGNKQADSGPADCGPWTSPCVSLESLFRDTNSLKYSLSGNADISQGM